MNTAVRNQLVKVEGESKKKKENKIRVKKRVIDIWKYKRIYYGVFFYIETKNNLFPKFRKNC